MSYSDRYKERIEQLENEIKDKQEEIELTNNQSTIDILEEDIYNTRPVSYTHLTLPTICSV